MRARLLIIPIDDVLRLFRDYIGMTTDLPEDTKVEALFPTPYGLCLKVSSEEWTKDQGQEVIDFDLKHTYVVN